jgi:hypothetical protein
MNCKHAYSHFPWVSVLFKFWAREKTANSLFQACLCGAFVAFSSNLSLHFILIQFSLNWGESRDGAFNDFLYPSSLFKSKLSNV